ncbi:MAG: glycosyltransferase family 39 protein [Bacteroidia bacterium]|nr:glycosyltransferase family 39 protein [Bacteroidia bacterium]
METKTFRTVSLGSLLLFAFICFLLNPIGEFPLNDDWAFSRSVKTFSETGEIRYPDWSSIPFVSQFIIGGAFCKVFGFSFTLLRIVTLLTFCFLTILLLKSLCFVNTKRSFAVIGLLTFILCPLSLNLSFSFMPDVYVLLFSLLSAFFFWRFFSSDKKIFFIGALVFSVAASLSRQSAIVLPLAFALTFLFHKTINLKNIFIAALPLLLNLLALFLFEKLLLATNKLPANYNIQLHTITTSLFHPNPSALKNLLYYSQTAYVSIGILLFPVSVPLFLSWKKENSPNQNAKTLYAVLLLLLLCGTVFKILLTQNYFPFAGNVFYPSGIGPVILNGFDSQQFSVESLSGKILCSFISLAGTLSFFFILVLYIQQLKIISKNKKQKEISLKDFVFIFSLLTCVLYVLPLSLSFINDRYLLFVLPFILIALSCIEIKSQLNLKLSLALLLPIAWFSVCGTHDYLSLNRARWQALNYLTNEKKISAIEIDGGFEFNAWYLYGKAPYNPNHTGKWWWVQNDNYVVTPADLPTYTTIKTIPFSSWKDFSKKDIKILCKTP